MYQSENGITGDSIQMATEIFENLKRAVMGYDPEGAASWAREAVETKIDPIKTINVLTEAIRQVGDGFRRGELWLPDLIGAANAMQRAMPIIEEEIKRTGAKKRKSLGTVVAGTVFGDIHSIGKNMVCTLLTVEGFEVHDLGINITAEEFVNAVKEQEADILAMSALMTTTAPEQKKVIDILNKEGLRDKVKVMVGGAAITAEFAENIGADGYDPVALGAVGLAKRLVVKNKGR